MNSTSSVIRQEFLLDLEKLPSCYSEDTHPTSYTDISPTDRINKIVLFFTWAIARQPVKNELPLFLIGPVVLKKEPTCVTNLLYTEALDTRGLTALF
jgi:hypothetical protein